MLPAVQRNSTTVAFTLVIGLGSAIVTGALSVVQLLVAAFALAVTIYPTPVVGARPVKVAEVAVILVVGVIDTVAPSRLVISKV